MHRLVPGVHVSRSHHFMGVTPDSPETTPGSFDGNCRGATSATTEIETKSATSQSPKEDDDVDPD
jgi:hypothetical protein